MTLADRCLNFLTKRIDRQKPHGASLDTLKCACLDLIEDVCPVRRSALSRSILSARQRSDLQDLRPALSGSVRMSFGETIARERMARLDNLMA